MKSWSLNNFLVLFNFNFIFYNNIRSTYIFPVLEYCINNQGLKEDINEISLILKKKNTYKIRERNIMIMKNIIKHAIKCTYESFILFNDY